MQPVVVGAPHTLAALKTAPGNWLLLSRIFSGLLEEVVEHLHLDLDVAAGEVEDGALGHDGHSVLGVLGVLRGLGLALNLRPGVLGLIKEMLI